jgi:hypothetical protein
MSKLSRNIRVMNRQGTFYSAKVIEVVGNRATVRLSEGGVVYRSLEVYGGIVSIGQVVKVDMTTDVPYIIVSSTQQQPAAVTTNIMPAKKTAKGTEVITGDILRYYGSYLLAGYPLTVDGLNTALNDLEDNQTIVYPIGTLEVDFTLPANTNFKGSDPLLSIIWGTVTLSGNTNLSTLLILDELSSGSGNAIAVVGPSSGETNMVNVSASAYTCGNGNAYGLYQPYGGNSIAGNSKFIGESRDGLGYGVYQEEAP